VELGVSQDSDNTRRAARLLRWYPPAWRERYGEEFADHLEQEFADRRVDLRRSLDVAHKGLVARIDDVGLSTSAVSPVAKLVRRSHEFCVYGTSGGPALNFWSGPCSCGALARTIRFRLMPRQAFSR